MNLNGVSRVDCGELAPIVHFDARLRQFLLKTEDELMKTKEREQLSSAFDRIESMGRVRTMRIFCECACQPSGVQYGTVSPIIAGTGLGAAIACIE
jgi:hypothetical protein